MNTHTPKFKKIIAREGLVILGVLVIGAIIFAVASLIPATDPYRYSCLIDGKKYNFRTSSYNLEVEQLNSLFDALFPGVLDAEYPLHSENTKLWDMNPEKARAELARRESMRREFEGGLSGFQELLNNPDFLNLPEAEQDSIIQKAFGELGREAKAKYPVYKELNEVDLGRRILAKITNKGPVDLLSKSQLIERRALLLDKKNRPKFDPATMKLVKSNALDPKYNYEGRTLLVELKYNLFVFAFFFLILSYPAYLIIRFVVWAVKTLRE